jgi:hypothetical protein
VKRPAASIASVIAVLCGSLAAQIPATKQPNPTRSLDGQFGPVVARHIDQERKEIEE